jgi:uncharacterized protein YfeS
VIFLLLIDREELSLSVVTSFGSFNECLETHHLLIGAPSKSRYSSGKGTETINDSEANHGTELILE